LGVFSERKKNGGLYHGQSSKLDRHFFEANDYLQNLGVTDLFAESKSDLSYVDKAVHKAFVEANERD
jgi:hypothetical protein